MEVNLLVASAALVLFILTLVIYRCKARPMLDKSTNDMELQKKSIKSTQTQTTFSPHYYPAQTDSVDLQGRQEASEMELSNDITPKSASAKHHSAILHDCPANRAPICFIVDTPIYQNSYSVDTQLEQPLTKVATGSIGYITKEDLPLLHSKYRLPVNIMIADGKEGYCSNSYICEEKYSIAALKQAERLGMNQWHLNDWLIWDIWAEFKHNQEMIDSCACMLADGQDFNTSTDWPAYCNYFREADIVIERVEEMRQSASMVIKTQTVENYENGATCEVQARHDDTSTSSLNDHDQQISFTLTTGQGTTTETFDLRELARERDRIWRLAAPVSSSAIKLRDLRLSTLTLPRDGCSVGEICSYVLYVLASMGMSGYGAAKVMTEAQEIFDHQIAYINGLIEGYLSGDFVAAGTKKLIQQEYDRLTRNNHIVLKKMLSSLKSNLIESRVPYIDTYHVADRFIQGSIDSLIKPNWIERRRPKDTEWLADLNIPESPLQIAYPEDVLLKLDQVEIQIIV